MPVLINPEFSALSVAKLLVLRTYWGWANSPWVDAEFTEAEIAQHWDDNFDDLQDARYDTRHHGAAVSIPNRIHHTWERNYEVSTRVIFLGNGLGLAYNYVTGGGKHGNPDDFPWWQECWFVKHTHTQERITHTHVYEDIPEVKDEPASE